MSDNYGWCQSCGALVFNSSQCHKCDGMVKIFCVDMELVKQAERIKKLKESGYLRHKHNCKMGEYNTLLTGKGCDCGLSEILEGEIIWPN